jgi:hypothetical protein
VNFTVQPPPVASWLGGVTEVGELTMNDEVAAPFRPGVIVTVLPVTATVTDPERPQPKQP